MPCDMRKAAQLLHQSEAAVLQILKVEALEGGAALVTARLKER